MRAVRGLSVLAVLLGLMVPVGAAGETGAEATEASGSRPLALDEAVDRAMHHPNLKARAKARRQAVRARITGLRRWPNPGLAWSREQVNQADQWVAEDFFTLSQAIPGPARKFRIRAARGNLEVVDAEEAARRRDLAAKVHRAYWRVAAVNARLEAARQWRQRLNDALETMKSRVEVGEASRFELQRLKRELADVDATMGTLKADRERERGELAGVTGLPLDGRWTVSATLGINGELEDWETFRAALEERPDLRKLERRARQKRLEAKAARRQWWPDPSVTGGYKRADALPGSNHGFIVGVSLTLPVFRRGKAEADVAEAERRSVEATMGRRLEAARARLRGERRQVEQLLETVEAFEEQGVRRAESLVETARRAYRADEIGILELLDAHRGLMEARTKAVQLRLEARLAHVELKHLAGMLTYEEEK